MWNTTQFAKLINKIFFCLKVEDKNFLKGQIKTHRSSWFQFDNSQGIRDNDTLHFVVWRWDTFVAFQVCQALFASLGLMREHAFIRESSEHKSGDNKTHTKNAYLWRREQKFCLALGNEWRLGCGLWRIFYAKTLNISLKIKKKRHE